MAGPEIDQSTVTTWITGLLGGGLGLYTLVRVFRRDSRNDNLVQQVDAGTQQLIDNLRSEVARLSGRVASMEEELVRLHEERALLLNKVAALEAGAQQVRLL